MPSESKPQWMRDAAKKILAYLTKPCTCKQCEVDAIDIISSEFAKAHPPATPDLTQLNNYLGLPLDNQDTTVMVEAVKALRHNVRVFQAAAEAPVISGDGWVSVEERLPLGGYGVLLAIDGHHVQYGFLRSSPGPKAARWSALNHVITGNVTHWMSLPSLPEGTRK